MPSNLREDPTWVALSANAEAIKRTHLRQLFKDDPQRASRMSLEAIGIYLDYSKNRVAEESVRLLLQLAESRGLRPAIDSMFRGDKINRTENRAVLHVALRAPKDATILVDGENVVPEVHRVLDKMESFASQVRAGKWLGHTGKP